MIETIVTDNNISQILKSNNIVQKYCYNLSKYSGRNTATLFYGICDNSDLNSILKHKGKKLIFFDINYCTKSDIENIKRRLRSPEIKKNLINILCDNIETQTFLTENEISSVSIKNLSEIQETVVDTEISYEETIVRENVPRIIQVDMDSFEEELKEKKKNSNIAKKFDMYVNEISNDEIPKNDLFNQFMNSYQKFYEENKLDEEKYFEFISTQESSINESSMVESNDNESNDNESNDNDSVTSHNSIHSDDDLNINYEDTQKNISTLNL